MKKKSIFVDAHQLDNGFEGSASFIQGLYLALVRRNSPACRIYLGCANPDRVMASFEGDPHFEPIKYGTGNRYKRLAFDIPQAISKCRADFAHFQYFTPLIKSCPWIVTIHDVLFNDFPQYFPPGYAKVRNILFPISARRADLLTTVSDYSRQRISSWYGVDLRKIAVVPNGVPSVDLNGKQATDARVARLLSLSGGYVLCVSRFEPRKNQAALLSSYLLGEFWRQGLHIVFVGSRTLGGGDFDTTLAAVPTEAKDFLHFLEGVSFTDIQLLYANARVAVYPSFAEGFGMPPLEAAAVGTPSLCAQTTAMQEFDCLKPYFFDPADRAGLKELMHQVIAAPQEARRIAAEIQSQVLAQYSWDRAAVLFEKQLSILSDKS